MSLVITLFCCFLLVDGNVSEKYDEEAGKAYLKKINADIQVKTTESVLASWAYESNITDENLQHQLDVSAKLANYTKEIWKETIKYPWKSFSDPDVRRQFQKFSVLGTAILSSEKYERFNKIISDMQSVYGKAKICNYRNRSDCSLQLEPELTEIFVKSRDPDELRYYWEEWRNAAGKPVREMYKEYVDLSNEAAVLNNFTNNAEFWLKDYEAKDFKEQVEALWVQLRPLYLQLHAFVRRRLREQYGEQHVSKRGPIPAHLLGNMWAQSWGNIFDFSAPYPNKPSMDVTPSMVEQGYTPLRMFKLAEEFFTSLNLSPMPDTFWKNSILEKPTDGRDLICHASAWDFYDGKDFRIKQCTRITMEDLNTVHHEMGHIQYFLQYKNQPLVYKEGTNPGRIIEPQPPERIKQCTRVTFRQLVTVHHEMGHIQYYLQYKNQPKIYRRGANPGFHEAVGDVMALSVSTPKHLRKIGLLNATEDDTESDINQLFSMALDKIAFLPFGYLMDQWRWSVFEGKTTEKDYNCKWWQLREKYQGLSPTGARTEDDFDPGAKYHTVGNVPYIRYFVSFVIQFQFHRSLCIAAKEYNPDDPASKPLHKCDIYQSKEAGALLKEMLQLGSSKPWPYAMEVMTGQRKMDASALLEYFATLQAWLEEENKKTGEFIGWESSQGECICEEKEGTVGVKSSDTQGNFEDDNIAYSYAEFVRQDDNSFGFPDYLEEVQPSYKALRHRSKENQLRGNYVLPQRKCRKSRKLYPPDEAYMQKSKNYVDVPALKSLNTRLHHQPMFSKVGFRKQKFSQNPNFKNLVNKDEIRLMNAILKEGRYLDNIKESKQLLPEQCAYISRRDIKKEEKNASAYMTNEETEKDMKSKLQEKKNFSEEYKLTIENNDEEEKSSAEEEKNSSEDKTQDANASAEQEEEQRIEKPDSLNRGSLKKNPQLLSKNSEGVKGPKDLIWKAELIKKEAEKMLKNFNLSLSTDNSSLSKEEADEEGKPSNVNDNSENRYSLPPAYEKFFHHNPESNVPGKTSEAKLKSVANTLSTDKVGNLKNVAESKNRLHFKEYDLVGVIPVGDLFVQRETKLESEEKKRHVEVPGSSELTYVMLVGKLSEKGTNARSNWKKKQKKSYKEYRFKPKCPVIYNSVVISPGGKADKPEEGRALSESNKSLRAATTRRRLRESVLRERQRSRRMFYSKNSFSSSVKNNKFNKNNIVQYFGCLQLLL